MGRGLGSNSGLFFTWVTCSFSFLLDKIPSGFYRFESSAKTNISEF